jgi:hypothetical protein
MTAETHSQLANFIWSICNLLRGPYKRNEYRKVILPLTVLRRFDCLLAPTKATVLKEHAKIKTKQESVVRNLLEKITGRAFYNLSKLDVPKLLDDPNQLAPNLNSYVHGFSRNVRDIMDRFAFDQQIARMAEKNLLYEVIKTFVRIDLSTERVDNVQMGYVFEELIRIMAAPLLLEQRTIADFLDTQTAKLDTLVAQKRALIEKLKEKHTALISRTVTRGLPPEAARAAGLNPCPEMKRSGVDWIGDVPKHWRLTRLKFVVPMIEQGWSPDCDSRASEGDECGVLKAGCCNNGRFNANENKALPPDVEPLPKLEVHPGEVLMSRASGSEELIGSAALVPPNTRPHLFLSDKTYRLRADERVVVPSHLVCLLQSSIGRFQIRRAISGASGLAKNITQNDVKNFWFAIPPIKEQHTIGAFLAREAIKIDQMVAEVEVAIERLLEYRIALVTAAVTGKIDVQNWAA